MKKRMVSVDLDAEELEGLIVFHADKAADAYVAGRVKELDRHSARKEELARVLGRMKAENVEMW